LRSRVPSDIELGIDFFQIRGQPEFDSEGHTDYKTERPCSRHNPAKRTDSAAKRFCDGCHEGHADDATEPF
jgi:hypothetical protein